MPVGVMVHTSKNCLVAHATYTIDAKRYRITKEANDLSTAVAFSVRIANMRHQGTRALHQWAMADTNVKVTLLS